MLLILKVGKQHFCVKLRNELVVVLYLTALPDSIAVYIGPSARERVKKKREMIDKRKMSKQSHPAPTASPVGPCPALIHISRTPEHFGWLVVLGLTAI